MAKVLLTEDGDSTRGGTWIDNAPDTGDYLRLTEVTEYIATGEVINDARWGLVQVFKETKRTSEVQASAPHPNQCDK